ncbi:NUDIX hydrolase [Deinococcus radiodurans]|nr:NUDIX hydrolase [Deinococcus radiodurans]
MAEEGKSGPRPRQGEQPRNGRGPARPGHPAGAGRPAAATAAAHPAPAAAKPAPWTGHEHHRHTDPGPPKKRGQKRPAGEPRIGVGCIVLRGEEILLVRERGRWSLPKGGLEAGELIQDGARRETFEETGLVVELRDLAFIVEFQAETWGHHLQFFYTGREVSGTLQPRDPDRDVQEARFIPIRQLREFIRFRPRLVALETWLRERRPRHFVFNLDKEPAMLRKRRRVGEGGVVVPVPSLDDADGEPDF